LSGTNMSGSRKPNAPGPPRATLPKLPPKRPTNRIWSVRALLGGTPAFFAQRRDVKNLVSGKPRQVRKFLIVSEPVISDQGNASNLAPVLLVEDNPDDLLLMRRAWAKAGAQRVLLHACDGVEATKLLGNEHPATRLKILPSLILLDIKMPRMDGFETLRWLKSQAHLKDIRVLMLSSSALEVDRERAHELGAAGFATKPGSLDELVKWVRSIQSECPSNV
jgi:CheY-like chemotaxis protein